MPRYKVVVEAHEPLLLGQSLPSGNVQSSRPFVAGSVLRGVVARAILAPLGLWRHSGHPVEEGSPPERFRRIFLEEPVVRFGFLYPVREGNNGARERDVFPIPLTAWSCKAREGFEANRGHGVSDQLLGALRREAGGRADWLTECPREECTERLDRMRGYGVRDRADDVASYCQAKAAPRTFVRVGLNRLTETAEERILYTLEALVPGGDDLEKPLSFVGYWGMEGMQWETVLGLLNDHLLMEDGSYPLRIGTARARGMGSVRLYLPDGPTPFVPLPERLDRFQPRDSEGQLLDEAHLYFGITLRAPLLVYNTQGQPIMKIWPEVLRVYVNTVPSDLELLSNASIVEQETWSGWSSAWGLPKPVTPAIAAGSVVAFRAPAEEREAVLAFLQEVEGNGLGERRAEGWGEVAACDPFHMIFDAGGAR